MFTVEKKGYAKLNLYLDILSRFSDGYHEVNTVMQSVSLCDDIRISLENKTNEIQVICDDPTVPLDSSNIAVKAARLFLDKIGDSCDRGVKIFITKRIPVAAGLGGGSADAAAVLCGLNELFGFIKNVGRGDCFALFIDAIFGNQ